MAKLGELIGRIQNAVQADRPTDESMLTLADIKFVLDYCTAFAIADRAQKAMATRRGAFNYGTDPSLYTRYKVPVLKDEHGFPYIELPATPMSLPLNFGIESVTTVGIPERGISPVLINRGTQSLAQIETRVPYGMPMWVRIGSRLYLYKLGPNKELFVTIIGAFSPDALTDACLESPYPLPQDLIKDVVDMAVQVLIFGVSLPDDVANDGKDKTAKQQQ